MHNIMTPEEKSTPVTFGDLAIFSEAILAQLSDAMIKSDEAMFNGVASLVDMLANRINEIEYKRARDMRFLLSYLGSLRPSIDLYKTYEAYCEEFDKLNKKEQ